MTDKTKKALKVASGVAIAVGAAGYILTGGDEAGALSIVSAGVGVVGVIGTLIGLIKK